MWSLLGRVSRGGLQVEVRGKPKWGFEFGQAFLERALLQCAQEDACEVTHGIGDTRVQLASAKLIDRISQEWANRVKSEGCEA